jgi:hypothetical protein
LMSLVCTALTMPLTNLALGRRAVPAPAGNAPPGLHYRKITDDSLKADEVIKSASSGADR